MLLKNKYFLFIFFTIFFTVIVFFIKNYFFWWLQKIENEYIEQNYIEPTSQIDKNLEEKSEEEKIEDDLQKKIAEKILSNLNSAWEIEYFFIPQKFLDEPRAFEYYELLDTFLKSENIFDKIKKLDVLLYKNEWKVRWNLKNWKIRLYSLDSIKKWEFLAVWVHEFAHYLDLYYLENNWWYDPSDDFYNISWESIKTIKSWMNWEDFVSGYAMTNKYEDFAESFTYYVLHNEDFLAKTNSSEILKQKYDFFQENLFDQELFKTDLYKTTNKIQDYYWDTTKINFSLENFLQYLKK